MAPVLPRFVVPRVLIVEFIKVTTRLSVATYPVVAVPGLLIAEYVAATTENLVITYFGLTGIVPLLLVLGSRG